MLKILKPIFFCYLIFICTNISFAQQSATIDGHPAWIMQGNIYEVNVRQYTPEGTFKAFEKSLPRLKEMGVQTLWFMPINPISKVDRKGALGSYYAVANYTAINPEFGTIDDWKSLVKHCHDMGFKIIIDWVPNHTGADNYWLTSHPDFYVQDSTGKAVSQFDWTDTRKLNYHNPIVGDSMIRCMKFWIDSTNIDGFRCDYAVGPTKEFWTKCVKELKADKNVFMLAETDSSWLLDAGFDAVYTWPEFNVMKNIAAGKTNALALDSVLNNVDSTFPANGLLMYFTSNHDENSWNKADYGTMPGASHPPFAVLTQTLPRSIPEIYSGQEEPFLDSISFFYKDTITFGKYARADFYSKLLHLRESNNALEANASFKKLKTNDDDNVYAFIRKNGKNKILVIVNLNNTAQEFKIEDTDINGDPMNVFTSKKEKLINTESIKLEAWGYDVYVY
ncbi:MAG: alpha-amylase family glycosyl hydrolase [Parafilimonas sp.]